MQTRTNLRRSAVALLLLVLLTGGRAEAGGTYQGPVTFTARVRHVTCWLWCGGWAAGRVYGHPVGGMVFGWNWHEGQVVTVTGYLANGRLERAQAR